MSWDERFYLIDTNALSSLTPLQRASDFFRERCRIPSEVLYEARFFPDIKSLKANEYPTTPRVLDILVSVMATVPAGDTKLVDLYRNRGNADPLVVACALDGARDSGGLLFGPSWVVVSRDRAVRDKACEFEIETITSDEFATLLQH